MRRNAARTWAAAAIVLGSTAALADKYGISEAEEVGSSSIGLLGIVGIIIALLALLAVVGTAAEKWPAILPLSFLLLFVVVPLVRCATG